MTRAGQTIQVQFVLTATIIYYAMALDMPNWMHNEIDKIRRNYLWRGRKEAKGALLQKRFVVSAVKSFFVSVSPANTILRIQKIDYFSYRLFPADT
jgi:hypothetical protein